MQQFFCPRCHGEVEKSNTFCPHCGYGPARPSQASASTSPPGSGMKGNGVTGPRYALDVKGILLTSLRLYRTHALLLGSALPAPLTLPILAVIFDGQPSQPSGPTLLTLVSFIVWWSVYSVQAGALTLLASQAYLGGPVDPFQAYADAASRFWALLLTTLGYFAAGGLGITLVLTAPFAVWFWISTAFHKEILLIEGKRGFDRNSWSYRIVQGYWWRIFGVFLSAALLAAYAFLILAVLIVILTLPFGDQTGLEVILCCVCLAVPMSFVAVVKVVLYYDLRLRRASPNPMGANPITP